MKTVKVAIVTKGNTGLAVECASYADAYALSGLVAGQALRVSIDGILTLGPIGELLDQDKAEA